MSAPIRITVLISGNGTNLQALLDAQSSLAPSPQTAEIVRVISNRKNAHGLVRAANSGIPTAYHNLLAYKKKHAAAAAAVAADNNDTAAQAAYDADLAALVLADAPRLVVCAGFMHILGGAFLEPVRAAGVDVVNLHPALHGRFNGSGAIERAHGEFMAGRIGETGVMIHYVCFGGRACVLCLRRLFGRRLMTLNYSRSLRKSTWDSRCSRCLFRLRIQPTTILKR
jgi:phosphoribosylglycinamide formyltransferase